MEPKIEFLEVGFHIKQEPHADVKEEQLDCEHEGNAEDYNPSSWTVMKDKYYNSAETGDLVMKFEETPVDIKSETIKSDGESLSGTSSNMMDVISVHSSQKLSYPLVFKSNKDIDQMGEIQMKKRRKCLNSCIVCNKLFTDRGSLMAHMPTHTELGLLSCEICNKLFTERAHLKRHNRVHTGERPYSCEICNRSFGESGTLKKHMFTHTGQRPHKCMICNKSFTVHTTLKRHILTHSGQKHRKGQQPHKCEVCSKSFSQKSTLKTHMLIHTSKQLYTCEICNKPFTQGRNLKTHMRFTHTGQRPYKCEDCGLSFRQKIHLRKHKLTHDPLLCVICNKSFQSDGHINIHVHTSIEQRKHKERHILPKPVTIPSHSVDITQFSILYNGIF